MRGGCCTDNVDTVATFVQIVTSVAQERGMKVVVRKWGNSASVRIPASVMEAAALSLDQTVDVREEAGRIVIEPIHAETFDVDELVAGITEENRHDAVETGTPRGREFW